MAIAGESVSGRLLEFRQQTPEKLVPTVPLAQAVTPELVKANQIKIRDAYWQVMYDETINRIKRDLEFSLNTQERGAISHQMFKSELLVEKGCFWFTYLTPEQRTKLEGDPVSLTARERHDGLTLAEKKEQRLKRKAYMLNRERKIDWQRGIDKFIWRRLNDRFFLESKGITYADIDEELSKGFLETFDRNEEMYNFLLGVGWNQKIVDIFNNRSQQVEELREILSQRMKRKKDGTIVLMTKFETDDELKKNGEARIHFEDFKNDEDRVNEIKNTLWDKEGDGLGELRQKLEIAKANIVNTRDLFKTLGKDEQALIDRRSQIFFGEEFIKLDEYRQQLRVLTGIGKTAELMRALRIVQRAEMADSDPRSDPKHPEHYRFQERHSYGLINEKLLSRGGKLDKFDGFTDEQQWQLNNRSQTLFGDDFLNLSQEEQLMSVVGPGEILSLEEIMSFLSDYAAPSPYNKTSSKIRPESEDLEYAEWIRLGWVSMIGPWRLADRINKMIFTYSARDDQRLLQRQQVESAGMSGFGKYVYFDWDYYEAFHGAGGEGRRKTLLEGTVNKVTWPEGFWREYQNSQDGAYKQYVKAVKKENDARMLAGDQPKRIADFDEFSYGMLGVGGYQRIAKEWFLSGWRLVAEGVYLKLRGEAVEQAARRNVEAKQIDETLDGDVMGQKITHAGKEILVKRYLDAKRTVLGDIKELLFAWTDKTGHRGSRFWTALGDLFLDKIGLDFLLKDREVLGFKTTILGLLNFGFFGTKAIINLLSTKAVVSILPFSIPWLLGSGGGIVAALPSGALWLSIAAALVWIKDKLYLRQEEGEAKWAEMEKKMNEKFKALAANQTRELIDSAWDKEKASIDTHEPIKII